MSLLQRYKGQRDPLRSERYVEGAVLVLLLLFLVQLLWGGYRSIFPAIPEAVQPTEEALQVLRLNNGEPLTPELRGEIVQRPLFWVARRPIGPVATAQEQAAAAAELEQAKPGQLKGLKLAGVFGAGEGAGIILLAKEKNKKHRVRVGQAINGWTLDSVTETEAVFNSNGRQATLELKRGKILVTDVEPAPAPAATARAAGGDEGSAAAKPDNTGKAGKPRPGAGQRPRPNKDSLSLGRG